MLADYERQLASHLAAFSIPPDYRERLREYVASESEQADDAQGRRRRIVTRLDRLKELYGWGDLDRADYLAQRELLLRDLAALDARETGEDIHLDRLAELPSSVARMWSEADQAERNRIAGVLFEEVVINDNRVVAVKPRPEIADFFALDCCR